MNEHSFARKLSKALRDRGLYVWKINANFAGGVPDMWVAGPDGDIWLELKWGRLPIRSSTTINLGLSEQQSRWLRDRHLQGVRVAVVWGSADGLLVLSNPSIWSGLTAKKAQTFLVPFTEALDIICRYVGTGEKHGRAPTHPAISGAARDCNQTQVHLVAKARRAKADPNGPRRQDGHDPGRAHTVPEQARRGSHRLCVGLLPSARR